jgi:outer membrane lipoprotein-sorting protein
MNRFHVAVLIGCALALNATAPASADQKANKLLQEMVAASKAVKTFRAEVATVTDSFPMKMNIRGQVTFKAPGLLRADLKGSPEGDITFASDGKTLYTYNQKTNELTKTEFNSSMVTGYLSMYVLPIALLMEAQDFYNSVLKEGTSRVVGTRKIGKQSFQVVEVKVQDITMSVYLGKDRLAHRLSIAGKQGNQTFRFDSTLTKVVVNRPIDNSFFAYTPPKNAKVAERSTPNYEAKLVPVGQEAPNFTLPSPAGGQIALSEALRGKKALIVNFWFYG